MTKIKVTPTTKTKDDSDAARFYQRLRKTLGKRYKAGTDKRRRQRATRTQQAFSTKKSKPKVNYFTFANLMILLVVLFLVFGIAALYYLTMGLYVEIFGQFSESQQILNFGDFGASAVRGWFLIGPLLAWILDGSAWLLNNLDMTAFGMIGALLYCVLQTLEIAPTIIYESPEIMAYLIKRLQSHDKIRIDYKADSEAVKELKSRHNDYYDETLDKARSARMWAYIIDGCICFFLAPLVVLSATGTTTTLLDAMGAVEFGLEDLDPMNLFRILCSLFLIGLLAVITMRVTRMFRFFGNRVKD